MKEKIKPDFKKKLIISFAASLIFAAIVALLLALRNSWEIESVSTYLSDIFFICAVVLILLYVLCLLSRGGFFGHFSYLAQKRSARKNKTLPKYRTYQDYMENRPKGTFDVRLFLIPGIVFFVIALIFTLFAI